MTLNYAPAYLNNDHDYADLIDYIKKNPIPTESADLSKEFSFHITKQLRKFLQIIYTLQKDQRLSSYGIPVKRLTILCCRYGLLEFSKREDVKVIIEIYKKIIMDDRKCLDLTKEDILTEKKKLRQSYTMVHDGTFFPGKNVHNYIITNVYAFGFEKSDFCFYLFLIGLHDYDLPPNARKEINGVIKWFDEALIERELKLKKIIKKYKIK